ncbi:hypothetical protein Dpoa569_0001354 [Dickeya poaceiphila]|uniref:Uncharacterized protein n=1 Tax=Dickeya poaceiphila TaxID=568768 RepID=A0A5B8I6F2_9GAMM|nr:hypothetical protein Dpoa569_0001354 [Dickeya poaceiphila]
MLKTPQTADTAPDRLADFLCLNFGYMAGRAANTTPERGICPPTVCGFERPATLRNAGYCPSH